ncbi:hypothetical protein BV25DRAFT_1915793 [Artomyces pyxidatus]|uniref:Uncharacterized protein n=1 Tax=Artomyces pyxidatus TaxID=48021 RepID=A0ACB8T1I3_9AGAM|nr:hypothetical protein BV25DRAFT_1915793 [Artomyces pyxidatus]
MRLRRSHVLLLATSFTSGSLLPDFRHPIARSTVAGTCIASPETACTTLVALCIAEVAYGQIGANNIWSAPICFAAATCAGSAPVVDALCCSGSCTSLQGTTSLDYNIVYAPMVGSCAYASGGCPVTWTDYVNYFYNTIQATNTGDWPSSGDAVLGWWADIATWTGFCTGTNCVDGQIPYTNFDDWLHYSWSTIITTPGNPPITNPLSTDRNNNTDDWDPGASPPCSFADPSNCLKNSAPQEPPDDSSDAVDVQSKFSVRMFTSTAPYSFKLDLGSSVPAVESRDPVSPLPIGVASFQAKNIPPPVTINGGNPVHLNISGYLPPRNISVPSQLRATASDTMTTNTSGKNPLHILPAVRSDVCKSVVDTPSPLPTITYYCDYMPEICAGIRGSGFLTNDEVILTYDPFTDNRRRNSVCGTAVKKAFQQSGCCDPRRHDPQDWKVSCDEFPFNSVLEGGAANGAVVNAVSVREQAYQAVLQAAVSNLLKKDGDARTVWGYPTNRKSKAAGECHKFMLSLSGARPTGAPSEAVGAILPGGAFINNQETPGALEYVTRTLAGPPSATPTADTPYPTDAQALQPSKSYRTFDCRPCAVNCGIPVPSGALQALLEDRAGASTCTVPSTPTATAAAQADANTNAVAAVAAAAAAAAALSSVTSVSAPALAAAQAAVSASSAVSAAAAALAAASAPDDIASSLASASSALDTAQSSVAALTSIFNLGVPGVPDHSAAIASIISQTSIANSAAASVVTDMWNVKPADVGPVPQTANPATDPAVNGGGGPGAAPAKCFGAGSIGNLKIGSVLLTGAPVELTDAGSAAFFGLSIPDKIYLAAVGGCAGVYTWASGGPTPSFQVDCDTDEFGAYWNGVRQQCYHFTVSESDPTVGIYCGNNLGSIYSCLQGNGIFTTLTTAVFTWVPA